MPEGAVTAAVPADSFRHEALLYAGSADFVDRTAGFLRDGVAAGEPALVVVNAAKIEALRDELGADAEAVTFADMADVGRNPARIIPAWRAFVAAHPGRRLRGIGEPIWAERSSAELVECETHEALLNLAFAGSPAWWLLCPYDTTTLPPDVLAVAGRTHPFLMRNTESQASATYDTLRVTSPFDQPLPEPSVPFQQIEFEAGQLGELRRFVARHAIAAGFREGAVIDLRMAVNELATNSIRHGGGRGSLRTWCDGGNLIFEVRDSGQISHALVGRRRPALDQEGGWGVWLANQVCDLVQIHSSPHGTAIRVHVALP